MNTSPARILFFAAALAAFTTTSRAQTTATAAGHWEGTIHMEQRELGVVVDLAKNAAGAWIGSMTVPGSTTVDVPLAGLAVDGKNVRFTAHLPTLASFAGQLSDDATTLAGTASNAQGDTHFQLKRNGDAKVSVPPPSSALAKEFAGAWEGTAESDGKARRVGLKLSAAPDGTAVGTLIAVDAGNLEIPVTTVTIHEQELRLELRALSATFRGTLDASGAIAGEWSERTKRLTLTLKRSGAATR